MFYPTPSAVLCSLNICRHSCRWAVQMPETVCSVEMLQDHNTLLSCLVTFLATCTSDQPFVNTRPLCCRLVLHIHAVVLCLSHLGGVCKLNTRSPLSSLLLLLLFLSFPLLRNLSSWPGSNQPRSTERLIWTRYCRHIRSLSTFPKGRLQSEQI